jgi:hypothetical protein
VPGAARRDRLHNKNLRVLTAGLLGSDYTSGQMTYDLRRLRPNCLIRRLPHTNRYVLTADGVRIAVFYTKVYNRCSSRSPPQTRPRHRNYAPRYRPSPAT